MEQRNDTLRDRLLAHLPQSENIAAYREETAALLAKHEKALSTEKWSARALSFGALCVLLVSDSIWGPKLDAAATHMLLVIAAVLFFVAALAELRMFIYGSQVAILKEVKQVQLQLVELQASLKAGEK